MSYNDIRAMAKDVNLIERIAACAAQEGVLGSALDWAWANTWQLAGTPGWEAAWDYAEQVGIPNIGSDEGVITDGMILAAVQPAVAAG